MNAPTTTKTRKLGLRALHYLTCWALMGAIMASPALAAREAAGTVEYVQGDVWVIDQDKRYRRVQSGHALYSGETILTTEDGELHARMADEALLAIRPNTKLRIDSYQARGDTEDSAILSLIRGTFRSVTGWIGKYNRQRYQIRTPVATIGVRGTDHEPYFIPAAVPGGKIFGNPGVYDKVNEGETYIRGSFGGTLFIKPNQAGFISLSGRAPTRLNTIPGFFKPTMNEGMIVRRKKSLFKRLDQGLKKKQDVLRKIRERAGPSGPAPKPLLKMHRSSVPAGVVGGKIGKVSPGKLKRLKEKKAKPGVKHPRFKPGQGRVGPREIGAPVDANILRNKSLMLIPDQPEQPDSERLGGTQNRIPVKRKPGRQSTQDSDFQRGKGGGRRNKKQSVKKKAHDTTPQPTKGKQFTPDSGRPLRDRRDAKKKKAKKTKKKARGKMSGK